MQINNIQGCYHLFAFFFPHQVSLAHSIFTFSFLSATTLGWLLQKDCRSIHEYPIHQHASHRFHHKVVDCKGAGPTNDHVKFACAIKEINPPFVADDIKYERGLKMNMLCQHFRNGFFATVYMQLGINISQVGTNGVESNIKFTGNHFCAVSF